jgi:hypothetical protein
MTGKGLPSMTRYYCIYVIMFLFGWRFFFFFSFFVCVLPCRPRCLLLRRLQWIYLPDIQWTRRSVQTVLGCRSTSSFDQSTEERLD